jgi:hypothetical protein
MRIELDIFSGRPNPTWSLDDEQAAELLASFKALAASASQETFFDGLGYRGFRIAGLRGYDEVRVRGEIVETRQGSAWSRRYDQSRSLERFLLETSKAHIDDDLYRRIASEIERE